MDKDVKNEFPIPSVDEAKNYATKKGYKYAHLWFNELMSYGTSKLPQKWETLMHRFEMRCYEAKSYGRHIYGEASPVRWGGEV